MFSQIIGNEKIKELLKKSIQNNKTSHSYLFTGIEGIGKKEIAKEFSRILLCLNEENKGCNSCKSCTEFNSKNNPDFMIIEPEGNVIKINQIREMQQKVQEKPIISKNKIYIINNADKMTTEAQNCLLKTLEEPPKFVTIILIGTNENAFLSTIKSRCMMLCFEPIPNEELKQFLEKEYNITEITPTMLDMFQGSIAKALELKDKKEEYEKINSLIINLENMELIDIIDEAEILYQSKEEIQKMLEYINTILLNLAKRNSKYAKCVLIVEETKRRLKQNSNYDMCIDYLLYNLYEELV